MPHLKKIIAATAVTGALVLGGAVAANAATSTTTAKAPAASSTARPGAPAAGTTPSKANCPNM